MKKTFKPMSRAERASHVYKKKTLNVNDELNIKHDDDDLENVDDYWSTAVSMIGNRTIDSMDDTVVTEQSDTLFDLRNIRLSVKGSMPGAVPVKDMPGTGVDRSGRGPLHKMHGDLLVSKKRLTLKPEENDSEEYVDVSLGIEDKENVLPENALNGELNSISEAPVKGAVDAARDVPTEEDDKGMFGEEALGHGSGMESAGGGTGFEDYSVEAPDSFLVDDKAIADDVEEDFDSSDIKRTNSKEEHKKQMAQSKLIFSKSRSRKDQDSILIQDVRSARTLNKIRPLVCTDEINTAIMELDFLAYTNEESSYKAFSIFVIRGNVEIQTGNKTTLIKKGEATVIGEGDVYSLNCKSKNGASLFLSYAL